MTLARVIHRHWHAVQRDLLQLGYRRRDVFTTLTVDEMVSVCVAAPPGTAVHHAVNGGWTLTDHLLATEYEHRAGLVGAPNARIQRPGVTDTRPAKPVDIFNDHSRPVRTVTFDPMTIDEFETRREAWLKGA